MNFENIVLTRDELLFVSRLYHADNWLHQSFIPKRVDIDSLMETGLIEDIEAGEHTFYLLTEYGKRYYIYAKKHNFSLFLSESRQWIAILISLLALIVSLISICKPQ